MNTSSDARGLSALFKSVHGLRILCVVLLVALLAVIGTQLVRQPESLSSYQERYPYIDIARHLIPQEHFITTLQPLREYLIGVSQREPQNSVSIYFEYLNTGSNVAINPNTRILPASLIKVPMAMVVMKKIERGDWKLEDELIVTSEDKDSEWGELYKLPTGTSLSIKKLLEEMLVSSDNTAFRIFYRNLTNEELQEIVTALGLEELFSPDGKITTKEYTRLFRALYTSSYLERSNSQMLLEMLTRTSYDDYLGEGIPDSIPFAHKIGEHVGDRVMLDAGIVYVENRPYLLSVGIDYGIAGMTREHAHEVMKDISEASYKYISEYRGGQ